MRNAVALPAAKARMRSSRSGSIGSGTRASQPRNPASRATPRTSAVMTSGLDQPAWPARTSPQTRPSTPAEISATPGRSSRAWAAWLSGSSRSDSRHTATPIGTLTQKIQCQSRPSVTAPPTSGPRATARPASPP